MVEEDQAQALINETKKEGGRDHLRRNYEPAVRWSPPPAEDGILKAGSGWTDIFIYPGYRFKIVDRLITNFHLPESTLIMLVSALAGKEHIMAAYEEAVKDKYRFFSFWGCDVYNGRCRIRKTINFPLGRLEMGCLGGFSE